MALPKDNKLTAMLDDDEMRMLEEISDRAGTGMSQMVRTLVREKHAENAGKNVLKKVGRKT